MLLHSLLIITRGSPSVDMALFNLTQIRQSELYLKVSFCLLEEVPFGGLNFEGLVLKLAGHNLL